MSGFNTKTPMMDWSPWMRRDFSAENRGGALADAFKAVGRTADGYGETNDKNLLAGLANETDASKIDPTQFYSQANALKGKTIIDQNKDRVFKDDQQKRANELDARNDASYHLGVFNKEAAGDALKMDKPTFDAKYANAGGLDWAMMYDIQNKKEDRTFAIEDREKKNQLTDLQMQSTQSQINRANEDYTYTKQQREQNDNDNKFLNAYYSGSLNDELVNQYKDKVSPKVYGTVINEKSSSDILNKYKTWDEFKNSTDYADPKYNYQVKKTVYDSFGNKKDVSLTDQIKFEEIKSRQADITRVQEEYKKTYGVDMPVSEKSNFIYQGKLPEKMTESNDKSQIKEKTDKELRTIITGLQDLKKWGNSYNSEFSGPIDAATGAIGDLVGGQVSDGEAAFRSQREGIIGPATKAVYGGNASNADRENVNNMLPNFRDGETAWKEKQKTVFTKGLENFKTNIDVLKANGFDTSAYEDEYNKLLDNTKTNNNSNNNPEITSVRKKENIPSPITPKLLTPDDLAKHGIKFN